MDWSAQAAPPPGPPPGPPRGTPGTPAPPTAPSEVPGQRTREQAQQQGEEVQEDVLHPLRQLQQGGRGADEGAGNPFAEDKYLYVPGSQALLWEARVGGDSSSSGGGGAGARAPRSPMLLQVLVLVVGLLPEAILETCLAPLHPYLVRHLLPDATEGTVGRMRRDTWHV